MRFAHRQPLSLFDIATKCQCNAVVRQIMVDYVCKYTGHCLVLSVMAGGHITSKIASAAQTHCFLCFFKLTLTLMQPLSNLLSFSVQVSFHFLLPKILYVSSLSYDLI